MDVRRSHTKVLSVELHPALVYVNDRQGKKRANLAVPQELQRLLSLLKLLESSKDIKLADNETNIQVLAS